MVKRDKKNEALTSYQLKMLKRAYEPYQNEARTQLIGWVLGCLFTVGMSILGVYYSQNGARRCCTDCTSPLAPKSLNARLSTIKVILCLQ